MLRDFLHDARTHLRTLAESPGFTATAVVILALGLGAGTTLFTLVEGLYFEPPPGVDDPGQLVRATRSNDSYSGNGWGYPDYAFFRDHAEMVELATWASPRAMTADTGGALFTVDTGYVSANYFDVLGVRPTAGRAFLPGEDANPGDGPVALLSHGFWHRAFGGEPRAVGGALRLNGHPLTIVGVVPAGFRGTSPLDAPPDVWVPITQQPTLTPSRMDFLNRLEHSHAIWLDVVGRLRSGVGLEVAQAHVDALATALAEEVPKWSEDGEGVDLTAGYRYSPRTAERLAELLELLFAVVAAVLLIAGANVALLLSARASAQRREIGVRLALGAGRGRIARQILTESLLLTVAGGLVGWIVAFWSADVAAHFLPFEIAVDFAPDLRVLAATFGVALLVAFAVGLAPAFQASRTEPLAVIRDADPARGRSRLRDALVVAQMALSIVLALGAALFVRSFHTAASVDFGFDPDRRLLVSMNLGQHGYSVDEAHRFMERATGAAAAVTGVQRTSTMANAPFRGYMRSTFEAEGREDGSIATFNYVGPGYFEAMGITLAEGRGFSARDDAEAPPVAVVNETLAETFWPRSKALGRRLTLSEREVVVVGVARDVRDVELDGERSPYIYLPLPQGENTGFTLLVAAAGDPRALRRPLEQRLHALDPNVALTRVELLSAALGQRLGPYRLGATLVTAGGVLALVLAAVGLYGVLSYLVVRQTRILGIRMALGATAGRVARSVVARALTLAAVGLVLGLPAAWASGRLLERFLFQVSPSDPLSFFAVPPVLLAVVALASWRPAWRAARVDPIEALREE